MKTTFQRYIAELNEELSKNSEWSLEDLNESKNRLKLVRILHRNWSDHPVVKQMTEIVEKSVQDRQKDEVVS